MTVGLQVAYGTTHGEELEPLPSLRSGRVATIRDILCSFLFLFRVPKKMTTQAPTFTQPLQSVVVLEGSAATFEAHVSGKRSPACFCLIPWPLLQL